jgi:hypothetical protein
MVSATNNYDTFELNVLGSAVECYIAFCNGAVAENLERYLDPYITVADIFTNSESILVDSSRGK